LVECRDLLSKDSENGIWRVAGLKPRKERMGGYVLLGFTFVRCQSGVEYGCEVRIGGGCGGANGHDGWWRREG
jgi:hypothetical protein